MAAYLRALKKEIAVSILIFAGGVFYGYLSANYFPEMIEEYFEIVKEIFRPISISEMGKLELMSYILVNNSTKTFLAVVSGVIFALFPIFFLFSNGFILGMLYVLTQETLGTAGYLAGILPHGVFEIPALILSGALGLRLGYAFVRFLRRRGDLRGEFLMSLRTYFIVILPLLIIAAFIETFITTSLIGL